MSQPPVHSTSPPLFRKGIHSNDGRSKVRETARKYDLLAKSSNVPPSPALSHHSSVAIQVNDDHKTRTLTSSLSSSPDSTDSESINKPSLIVHRKLLDEEVTSDTNHISTARIELRPQTESKTVVQQKRTSPPKPQSLPSGRKIQPDNEPVYINNDLELKAKQTIFHRTDDDNDIEEFGSFPVYTKPILHRTSTMPVQLKNRSKHSDVDSIGLEITERGTIPQRQYMTDDSYLTDRHDHIQPIPTASTNHQTREIPEQSRLTTSHRLPPPPPPPPPPSFAKPFLQKPSLQQHSFSDETQEYVPHRSLPMTNFMIELTALVIIFIICMVLVLAIQEDENKLRTTMQLVYTYIYAVSITWMIWCTFDIIKFRRQWAKLTAEAQNDEDYMVLSDRNPHSMFYFPDIHNTGGLFMRIGAGLLCMGGLLLTLIELAKTAAKIGSDDDEPKTRAVPMTSFSSSVMVTRIIMYIFRFLFHCVQFTFLFRYGNIIVNRYHLFAKIGLLHVIIANFCTWFEAIVIETLEQLHKDADDHSSTTYPITIPTTVTPSFNDSNTTTIIVELVKGLAASASSDDSKNNKSVLTIINTIESTVGVYLYPCLIEYSLISLTVFFIMCKNVGKTEKRSFLRFRDRHVFTINCARASRGLLIGGILFLLTILTLIPEYLLEDDATSVTHITELVLFIVSLFTVCIAYYQTTKLYYDEHAHVDIFDQVLISITTVGDFAYSFFALFASMFTTETKSKLPVGVEISIGVLAIFQTFLQSGFIMDTLKRRTTSKEENRSKPGREAITALLLMNLAIWLHDSLSANKVRLNPSQVAYYDVSTWAIIQAFTSPLSIFYRFHSSVCLADIWQEVYHAHGNHDGTTFGGGKYRGQRLMTMSTVHDMQY